MRASSREACQSESEWRREQEKKKGDVGGGGERKRKKTEERKKKKKRKEKAKKNNVRVSKPKYIPFSDFRSKVSFLRKLICVFNF